ncbi:hypothetical protein BH09SUM1_BH09SUM1_14040 [soil metagenome]
MIHIPASFLSPDDQGFGDEDSAPPAPPVWLTDGLPGYEQKAFVYEDPHQAKHEQQARYAPDPDDPLGLSSIDPGGHGFSAEDSVDGTSLGGDSDFDLDEPTTDEIPGHAPFAPAEEEHPALRPHGEYAGHNPADPPYVGGNQYPQEVWSQPPSGSYPVQDLGQQGYYQDENQPQHPHRNRLEVQPGALAQGDYVDPDDYRPETHEPVQTGYGRGFETGANYDYQQQGPPADQQPNQYAQAYQQEQQYQEQGYQEHPYQEQQYQQPPAPTPGFEEQQAPTYRVPSVADLHKKRESQDQPGMGKMPEIPPPAFQQPTLDYHQAAAADSKPAARQTSLYTGTLAGADKHATPAVNQDGVPAFIPELTAIEDPALNGRRIAGLAWIVYALLVLAGGLAQGDIQTASYAGVPMIAMGAMLLAGFEWASVFALIVSAVVFLGFGILALAAIGVEDVISLTGLHEMPPAYGAAFFASGLFFLGGNLLMLLGQAGTGRAVSGAILKLLPLAALAAVFAMTPVRPRLIDPLSPTTSEVIGGEPTDYFGFEKPAGWVTYDWPAASIAQHPLLTGLEHQPRYFYLDKSQDLMVSFYITEKQHKSLTELFGERGLTDLEKEISHNLPPAGEPTKFTSKGLDFEENSYDGTLDNGAKLSVTIDRTDISDRTIYIVLSRDLRGKVTEEQGVAALDTFFDKFKPIK